MLGDHDIDVPDPRRTPVMKPDTFWLQNKSQIWKLLSKFEDPYGVIARKNVKVCVGVCAAVVVCVVLQWLTRETGVHTSGHVSRVLLS